MTIQFCPSPRTAEVNPCASGFSHFRLSMWARCLKLGFLGLQCFEGVFEFGGGGRCLPALMGSNPRLLSASAPSLTLWHGPLSHSIPNNRLLWQLVPAAGEEWRLCCDRDGQVVETKAEWGVGRCGRSAQLVWIPSQGSGTFSWRQVGSCQEQIDRQVQGQALLLTMEWL